jgi:histidinol-phosphate/aromatic aminotransferase/cobyric acid decarboxylase-like protein
MREILQIAKKDSWFVDQIQKVVIERNRLYTNCIGLKSNKYQIYESEANFILFKSKDENAHQALLSACEELSISTKDLNKLPKLKGCIRVSIGTTKENDLFFKAFQKANMVSKKIRR